MSSGIFAVLMLVVFGLVVFSISWFLFDPIRKPDQPNKPGA